MASQNERQGPVAGRSQRRSRPRLRRANVRAGRPRSRVGINHPTNRDHDLRHAQEWGKGLFARPKEPHGAVAVRSQRRRWPRLRRANVRAGRPRSRVGILHLTNREHDLRQAQEWGKGPFARRKATHGPAAVRSQRRRWPRLRRANVRAGRPRSRVGINHPTNWEPDLRHAQEWGKGPFARRKEPHGPVAVRSQRRTFPTPRRKVCGRPARNPPGTRASRPHPYSWLEEMERQHKVAGGQPPSGRERRWQGPRERTAPPRERGRPARNLIPGWRRRSGSAT